MRVSNYTKKANQSGADVLALGQRQLEELQAAVLGIAEDIASVCERNGIDWTLSGGSVLGAARHQGFIPWDDDIDINMSRASWEKFELIFAKEFGDKYQVRSPRSEGGCNVNAVKVYKRGTRLRELSTAEGEAEGIFVDIFIVENVPDSPILRGIHMLLCMGFRYAASCARMYEQREHLRSIFSGNARALRDYGRRISIGRILSVLPARKWVGFSYAVNGLSKNDRSRLVTIQTGSKQYMGEMMARDEFYPPAKLRFGDHLWPVPKNYDAYLSHLYGDWHKIPEEADREQHVLLELDFGEGGEI